MLLQLVQNFSGFGPFKRKTSYDEGNFSLLLDPLDDTVGFLRFDVTSVVDGDDHVLVFNDIEVSVLDKEAV